MDAIFQFVAQHRYLLWILLAIGISNLLQCTIFYGFAIRRSARWQLRTARWLRHYEPRSSQDPFSKSCWQFQKRMLQFLRRNYRSTWFRILSSLPGLATVLLAIAGLVLL